MLVCLAPWGVLLDFFLVERQVSVGWSLGGALAWTALLSWLGASSLARLFLKARAGFGLAAWLLGRSPRRGLGAAVAEAGAVGSSSGATPEDAPRLQPSNASPAASSEPELEDLCLSLDRYALAVRGSTDGLWDWDLTTNRVYFAPRWLEMLGLPADSMDGSPEAWFALLAPDQAAEFGHKLRTHLKSKREQFHARVMMQHTDGEPRWMLCRAATLRNAGGQAVRLAGSLSDITGLMQAQQDLSHMVNHDRLTGLPNREQFRKQLQRTIARSKRNPAHEFAVLFFDFDRFKVINDSLGHNLGDALLASIADRFRDELRECETAARFGGDEFVVLLEDLKGADSARAAGERLLSAFAAPHYIQGHEVVSTASIGLVVYNQDGYCDADEMLRDADTAMYQAKSSGRAQVCVFDREMHSKALQRLRLENDLRNADMDAEFVVYYQSIVDLKSCEVQGFEALLRWQHPVHGLVSPMDFIPIAEETGLIVSLGEWVLRTATRQLRAWQETHGRRGSLFMNVNLARKQLLSTGFLETLRGLVLEFDLQPGDIKLEITETTVMDERHDMLSAMEQIREMGFPLAMDDFGTGHSSLSCLHSFPIDVLKIDRSFILHLAEDDEFGAVVQAIVTLAHHLNLEVVAEGIETQEQLQQLRSLGCSHAQGYLFSKPVPAPEAELLLQSAQRNAA